MKWIKLAIKLIFRKMILTRIYSVITFLYLLAIIELYLEIDEYYFIVVSPI